VSVIWGALFGLALHLTEHIAWSIHLWLGSILLAGLVGLSLSVVLKPGR
jgi:hypothetical protein